MPDYKPNDLRFQDFKTLANTNKIQQTNRLLQEIQRRLKRNLLNNQANSKVPLSKEKRNSIVVANSPQRMKSSQQNQPSNQLVRLRKRNQELRQRLNNYTFGFTRILNERIKEIEKDCLRSEVVQLQTLQARRQQLLKERNRLLGVF